MYNGISAAGRGGGGATGGCDVASLATCGSPLQQWIAGAPINATQINAQPIARTDRPTNNNIFHPRANRSQRVCREKCVDMSGLAAIAENVFWFMAGSHRFHASGFSTIIAGAGSAPGMNGEEAIRRDRRRRRTCGL
jgi:hypothetical protein